MNDTVQITVLTDDDIRDRLQAVADWQQADDFFNRLGFVYDLLSGNPGAALVNGIATLEKCQSVAPNDYQRIHKGAPFYWLGMAAFRMNDYETATFFFDAGVAEDLRTRNGDITAGFRFLLIEGHEQAQAALELVEHMQLRVESAIHSYNARPGRPAAVPELTIARVRAQFLRRALQVGEEPVRTMATAFISWFLEWDYIVRLTKIRPVRGTSEPVFLHLFKGCLLFESLLKQKPAPRPNGRTLGAVLDELSPLLGIPNHLNISATLEAILHDLPGADDSIATAVQYTGKVRNTLGHNLGWSDEIDGGAYLRLAGMISTSCLHSIACLY